MNTQRAQAKARLRGYGYAFELGFDGVAYPSQESALNELRCRYPRYDIDAWRFYEQGACQALAERIALRMTPERFRDYQIKRIEIEEVTHGEEEAPAVQP
ncbi:hypothetical protein D9M71_36940 [compost metagenome]